jgi:hypothetical protein
MSLGPVEIPGEARREKEEQADLGTREHFLGMKGSWE